VTERTPEANPGNPIVLIGVWLWVLIPFGYGLYELIRSMTQLFN
jgi:hypothetical protein